MKFEVEIKKKDLQKFGARLENLDVGPKEKFAENIFREFFFFEYSVGTIDLRNKVKITLKKE